MEEEITRPGDPRLALFAQLAQLFDHFEPRDQFALIDHVRTLLDIGAHDRALVLQLAIRLERR